MFPYFLVMQPNASAPAGTVLTEEFWDEAGSSLQQLQQEANLPKNNVISLLWFEGTPSPWWLGESSKRDAALRVRVAPC